MSRPACLRAAGHRVLLHCQMAEAMDLVQAALDAACIPHLRLDAPSSSRAHSAMLQVPFAHLCDWHLGR